MDSFYKVRKFSKIIGSIFLFTHITGCGGSGDSMTLDGGGNQAYVVPHPGDRPVFLDPDSGNTIADNNVAASTTVRAALVAPSDEPATTAAAAPVRRNLTGGANSGTGSSSQTARVSLSPSEQQAKYDAEYLAHHPIPSQPLNFVQANPTDPGQMVNGLYMRVQTVEMSDATLKLFAYNAASRGDYEAENRYLQAATQATGAGIPMGDSGVINPDGSWDYNQQIADRYAGIHGALYPGQENAGNSGAPPSADADTVSGAPAESGGRIINGEQIRVASDRSVGTRGTGTRTTAVSSQTTNTSPPRRNGEVTDNMCVRFNCGTRPATAPNTTTVRSDRQATGATRLPTTSSAHPPSRITPPARGSLGRTVPLRH